MNETGVRWIRRLKTSVKRGGFGGKMESLRERGVLLFRFAVGAFLRLLSVIMG